MSLRMLVMTAFLCLAGTVVSGCIPAEAPQETTSPPATASVPAPAPAAADTAAVATPEPAIPETIEPAPAAPATPAIEEAPETPQPDAPVATTVQDDPAAAADYIAPDETIVLPSMGEEEEGRGRLLVSGAAPGQGNVSIGVSPVESATPALNVEGTLPDGTVAGTITKEALGAQDWHVDLTFSFTRPGYEIRSVLPSTMSGQPITAGGASPEAVMLQVTLKMPVYDPNAPEVLEEQKFTLDVPAPDETTFFFNVLPAD